MTCIQELVDRSPFLKTFLAVVCFYDYLRFPYTFAASQQGVIRTLTLQNRLMDVGMFVLTQRDADAPPPALWLPCASVLCLLCIFLASVHMHSKVLVLSLISLAVLSDYESERRETAPILTHALVHYIDSQVELVSIAATPGEVPLNIFLAVVCFYDYLRFSAHFLYFSCMS